MSSYTTGLTVPEKWIFDFPIAKNVLTCTFQQKTVAVLVFEKTFLCRELNWIRIFNRNMEFGQWCRSWGRGVKDDQLPESTPLWTYYTLRNYYRQINWRHLLEIFFFMSVPKPRKMYCKISSTSCISKKVFPDICFSEPFLRINKGCSKTPCIS